MRRQSSGPCVTNQWPSLPIKKVRFETPATAAAAEAPATTAAVETPATAAEAPAEYIIKCIHEQRGTGRWTEYLVDSVEWEGYNGERTWEPAAHLKDTTALAAWRRKK